MIATIKNILYLLTPDERRKAGVLFIAIMLMALAQVGGVASIMPFMGVVSNPDLVNSNPYLSYIYKTLGFTEVNHFLFFLGAAVLVTLTCTSAFAAFVTWGSLRFTAMRWHTLSQRLLAKYIQQDYAFFLRRNTSELTKNIFEEVTRVVTGVLMPSAELVAQATLAVAIIIFLIVIDPLLALLSVAVLGTAYGIIYYFTHSRLARLGAATVQANRERFKAAAEVLGGIKEIKLYGKERPFLTRYEDPSRSASRYRARHQIMSRLPKYAVETTAFGGILLIVLYLLQSGREIGSIIPLISLYAFAGYRLIPALQMVYRQSTTVRYNLASLDVLREELTDADRPTLNIDDDDDDLPPMPFQRTLSLSNISFRYSDSETDIVKKINFSIRANESIGMVGSTGCGKSTVVDLVLGILTPTSGEIRVDDETLRPDNIRAWQKNIGYVPQSIYLIDDTIKRNIALSTDDSSIDMSAVERAAHIACAHDFIVSELPDGYDTVIGERGVRLSGGQRQRIGIARALYRDPKVIIFDEATSALDSSTENTIMSRIYEMSGTKTMIMVAHRISTLRGCDRIIVFRNGEIEHEGSFKDLIQSSPEFRKLANDA